MPFNLGPQELFILLVIVLVPGIGVRAGGIATMLGLGGFLFVMIRSERRHSATSGK